MSDRSRAEDNAPRMSKADQAVVGVLAGPICGVNFRSPTRAGLTNERGEFSYREGESVAFLVGGLVLGTVRGASRVNLAQLVNRVAGNIDKLHDPGITNLARLVLSLDHEGNGEGGVTIAPVVHDVIGPGGERLGTAKFGGAPLCAERIEHERRLGVVQHGPERGEVFGVSPSSSQRTKPSPATRS